jgi:hypothetical protein
LLVTMSFANIQSSAEKYTSNPSEYVTASGAYTVSSFTDASSGIKYSLYTFTGNGSIKFSRNMYKVDYLVVGGGGGGGGSGGAGVRGCGGGGGGGVIYAQNQILYSSNNFTVTVGKGGSSAKNGDNSTFNGRIAYGGGAGGSAFNSLGSSIGGSSGGNGNGNQNSVPALVFSDNDKNTGSTGFNGTAPVNMFKGGGGGGAGGPAKKPSSSSNGDGGNGKSVNIGGKSIFCGAGGGGGINWQTTNPGASLGGIGGGGKGGIISSGTGIFSNGGSATGYGCGGGGAAFTGATTVPAGMYGGTGSDGIVMIQFPIFQ